MPSHIEELNMGGSYEHTQSASADEIYFPKPKVCARFNVTPMTLHNWRNNPAVGFPEPDLVVNTREYWGLSTLRRWERRQ